MFADRENDPQFSQPVRQIMSMLTVLILTGIAAYFAYPSVAPIFFASPYLNGVIIAVFVLGIAACFVQVFTLISAVSWIEGFALDRPGHEFVTPPRLLAPLAALLRSKGARYALTSTSTRSILDSVASRLDEARDITRYIVNLLIFLGLLGTFFGLATTVPAVVDTIRSLAPQDGESSLAGFDRLMTGLENQLGGMGTAFASSLLGLAGSLVVGLLELFAGHGQNRFYSELEEWLSYITRISFGSADGEGSGHDAGAILALMESSARQIDMLRAAVLDSETARRETDARMATMAASVQAIAARTDQTDQNNLLARIADGLRSQSEGISSGLDRLGEKLETRPATEVADHALFERIAGLEERILLVIEERKQDGEGFDAESRARLRNIDMQLLRVLEEIAAGRQDAVADLRASLSDIERTLQRAIDDGGKG